MNIFIRIIVCVIPAFFMQALAQEHEPHGIEHIIVSGHVQEKFSHQELQIDNQAFAASDVSNLMLKVPGGNINDNGPISGQTQYRGMYGIRMNVRLDGMYVNSGGPNWMDPPLHYMPASLLDSIEVSRGIASVSYGSGIGGHVLANSKSSEFTHDSEFNLSGDVDLGYHSTDNGYNIGGLIGFSNDTHRFHMIGSQEDGDNRSAGNGEIADTQYERYMIGAGYGFQYGVHRFSLDYRFSETDDSGTPVLPLDIDFFKTDLFRARYDGHIGPFDVVAQVSYSEIDHWMHNYITRPAPDFSSLPLPPFLEDDKRFVDTDSNGTGYSLILHYDMDDGIIDFGVDGHLAEHNATVGDPDFDPFFVNNFVNSQTDNIGFFGGYRGLIAPNITLELGLRYDHVKMSTEDVDAFPANLEPLASTPGTPPFAVRQLRNAFNALDRSVSDDNFDAVVKFDYVISGDTNIELGFARKTRSPSYIERFMWIPLEVNAGLGDGNNYVGDVELKPEVSHQFELGLNWDIEKAYMSPRVYYRTVDDYIQGVPATNMFVRAVSTNANGDPNPLIFANVDAEFYGFDTMYGYVFTENWRIDGIMSYTRGKRRDIDDDLFRIAPFNTRLTLAYDDDRNWGASVEGVLYAKQSKISQTITANSTSGNTGPVSGYALLNLHGYYNFCNNDVRLSNSR